MTKNSIIGDSPKAGAACGKPQAKARADKSAKRDVKPSRPVKKEK